ncbi:hypothetical protein CRENBAI_017522 [Crenichthys baileyi]|uniref:Uncharacterized protein n=1 Tax=Crenichthys baileyi TaxID=28760 RepID=A0AAV9QUF6_9TELE
MINLEDACLKKKFKLCKRSDRHAQVLQERDKRRRRERDKKERGEEEEASGGSETRCRRRLDLLQKEKGVGEQFQNSCPADVPVVRSVAPRGGYRRQDSVNKPQEQHCSIHTHEDTHFTLRRGGISDEDSDLAIQTAEKSVHLLKIPSPDWRAIVRLMQQLFLESCKWRVFLRM